MENLEEEVRKEEITRKGIKSEIYLGMGILLMMAGTLTTFFLSHAMAIDSYAKAHYKIEHPDKEPLATYRCQERSHGLLVGTFTSIAGLSSLGIGTYLLTKGALGEKKEEST